MSGRNNRRYLLVPIISFSIIFSPINFAFFLNTSFAEDTEEETEETAPETLAPEEWSGMKTVSGHVSIGSGATVVVSPGTVVEFDGVATLEVWGKLLIEGTPEHPVIFREKNPDNPDEYYKVVSFGTVYGRNMDVSGGGSIVDAVPIGINDSDVPFLNRAKAAVFYSGAFSFFDGSFDIEGANFHDNAVGIFSRKSGAKVWRSKFSRNTIDIVTQGVSADVRYDWWGSPSGPTACVEGCVYKQKYEKIIGDVSVAPWAEEADKRDPVVVVPGIMGSWRKTQESELELDPIFGVYDDLIETLDENGYEEGKDLFRFPYEWRMGNAETAKLLGTRIAAIKEQTKWPKVDIVAHSMGGLVTREYIRAFGGDASIDQFVTLGTPHKGAPKSYLQWEGGKFVGFSGFFAEKIFQQEAEENGYESIFDYIRGMPIRSVRELLPVYPYLRNVGESELMPYASPEYPMNTFLENLGTAAALQKLEKVSFTNIIGKTEDNATIEEIRIGGLSIELLGNPEKPILWGHGKPDGYDDLFGGDRGLDLGAGDGTVPIDSAREIVADETIELASRHGNLPSDAAEIVYRIFTGLDTTANIVKKSQPTSLLLVMPFSPVDIQVVSPSGLKVGKDFDGDGFLNQIPGAYYTGSDTKNEFITIPNPEDGEYAILARGTDDGGAYRIETTKITEATDGDVTESTATIEGEAVVDVMEEDMTVEVSANAVGLKDEAKDIVAPTVTIVSPESKTYPNSAMIPVSYSVSDDVTPNDGLTTVVSLDGATYAKPDIDAAFLPLGAHEFSVNATDEAGNVGTAEISFTIETSWDALSKNIDHYAALGLFRNKGERQMLKTHIRNLGETAEFLKKYDAFFRFHPKLRDIFEREIAHQLSILQRYVNQKSGKSIDPIAAGRLIESMEFLKKSL